MQTNPAVEQNLFAWCIQRSVTEAWTNLCTKHHPCSGKKRAPLLPNTDVGGIDCKYEYTSCRMSILCVLTPEIKPVKPGLLPAQKPGFTGFCPHKNPGLRVWKRAGYPGFRVPGYPGCIPLNEVTETAAFLSPPLGGGLGQRTMFILSSLENA